jgi:hypothetical protein
MCGGEGGRVFWRERNYPIRLRTASSMSRATAAGLAWRRPALSETEVSVRFTSFAPAVIQCLASVAGPAVGDWPFSLY